MFYSDVMNEYKTYLKFDRVVDEKTLELTENKEVIIALTEIGILLDNEIVFKKINLKLPNNEEVRLVFGYFPFRKRPHIPKIKFYRVYFNEGALKIDGLDTEVIIPLDGDFKFEGCIVVEEFDRQLLIMND